MFVGVLATPLVSKNIFEENNGFQENSNLYLVYRAKSRKLRQRSILTKKGTFLQKMHTINFNPLPPPLPIHIRFLSVLHQNKALYVMRCAIWYRFYNLKNVRNTHGGVSLLVKLQDSACHFTKSNTHPWGFFHVFKIVQMVPNRVNHLIIFIKKGRFLKLDAVFA